MAHIKIPTPLRQYTANAAEVAVSGATVGEALDDLTAQYPDLRPHLYNGEKLRNFVNVFLGEEDIRFLHGVETPIDPEARLRIVPAIAGGTISNLVIVVGCWQSIVRSNRTISGGTR